MFCTVPPCPLCLPQPLLWPRRPGSGHGSHAGGGGSGQGGSRQSGGGGTGANTGAGGGAGAGSGGAPASAAGGGGSSAVGGGAALLLAVGQRWGQLCLAGAVLQLLLAADSRGAAMYLAAVAA